MACRSPWVSFKLYFDQSAGGFKKKKVNLGNVQVFKREVTVSNPMAQKQLRRRIKFEAWHKYSETQAVVVIFLGVGGVGAASIF